MNEFYLASIYLLDVLILSALARVGWKALGFGVITNMILITVYSQFLIDVFGFVTNIGNLFYAAVVFGMSLCRSKNSPSGVMRVVHATFVSFAMFSIIGHLIDMLPILNGNEGPRSAMSFLFSINYSILSASFLAFYSGNVANIFLLPKIGKIGANIVTQLIDSLIFFPIAFSGVWEYDQVIQAMVVGFILKSCLNILDTPIYHFFKDKPDEC